MNASLHATTMPPQGGIALRVRRRLIRIPLREADPVRRGFRIASSEMTDRLHGIGLTFLGGCHAAIEEADVDGLMRRLEAVPLAERGFAYEGAAMGITICDLLSGASHRRWPEFRRRATAHCYMIQVGAGWALARIPVPPHRLLSQLDPLLGWLAIDGFGFHEGYFQARRLLAARIAPPRSLRGYAHRAFDQGLGRSLWFAAGGEPIAIVNALAAFGPERRSDLWSGIGLACTYAGGASEPAIATLCDLATRSGHHAALAQGAAFAARARLRAGNDVPHTEIACRQICHLSATRAAAIPDQELAALPPDRGAIGGPLPRYERWRAAIQARFMEESQEGRKA